MKLFVDDLRPAPNGWHEARSITEAIRILSTTSVDEVSLDYDIIGSIETFEPVAWYIRSMPRPPKVKIHTANPVGGNRMREILWERDYE